MLHTRPLMPHICVLSPSNIAIQQFYRESSNQLVYLYFYDYIIILKSTEGASILPICHYTSIYLGCISVQVIVNAKLWVTCQCFTLIMIMHEFHTLWLKIKLMPSSRKKHKEEARTYQRCRQISTVPDWCRFFTVLMN